MGISARVAFSKWAAPVVVPDIILSEMASHDVSGNDCKPRKTTHLTDFTKIGALGSQANDPLYSSICLGVPFIFSRIV